VAASLWLVNDASTSKLMQNFYGNLATGTDKAPMTKAQALRQAQLSMLRGDAATAENADSRTIFSVVPGSRTNSTNSTAPGFSHPYYWAPFILIGNSL
jgi:CHAT domain-containing protein